MREILFRGKREDGKWAHGFYYAYIRDDNGQKEHCILQDISSLTQDFKINYVDPATVGQYTGVKDSKRTEEYPEGQEIYEGDILHHKWDSGNDIWEETISEVKFSKGAFVVDDKKRSDWLLSLHALPKWAELKVIGNIHDNPELLEVR